MEDPKWLRLITIGLVLSALAVGYFLLTGRFASIKTTKPTNPVKQVEIAQVAPSPAKTSAPAPKVAAISSSRVTTLPKTGFPVVLVLTFSASAIVAGFALRKYPN